MKLTEEIRERTVGVGQDALTDGRDLLIENYCAV